MIDGKSLTIGDDHVRVPNQGDAMRKSIGHFGWVTFGLALVIAAAAIAQVGGTGQQSSAMRPSAAAALAQDKLDHARRALNLATEMLDKGLGEPTVEGICQWSRRVMEAEVETASTEQDKRAALQAYLARMNDLAATTKSRVAAGLLSSLAYDTVAFYRDEAEQLAAAAGV